MDGRNSKHIVNMEVMFHRNKESQNYAFRIVDQFEFHGYGNVWLVFDSKERRMVIGKNGIEYYPIEYAFDTEIYDFMDFGDEEFESVELTVFKGQELPRIDTITNGYQLNFNCFSMKAIFHDENSELITSGIGRGSSILAIGHHLLTKKCKCGGNGEPCIDFVSDFFVRCERCHSSTYAYTQLKEAVDKWNQGEMPCGGELESEDFFKNYTEKPIKQIVLNDRKNCFDIEFILEYEDICIGISSTILADGTYGFNFEMFSSYNKEIYSHVIKPKSGETKYVCTETDENGQRIMRFQFGDDVLIATPASHGMKIRMFNNSSKTDVD